MRETGKLTRRGFLKAAAVAVPYAVTSTALGGQGRPAASDRVAMGFIGVGSMGGGHLGGFLRHGGVQVVAVCDVDARQRQAARSRVDAWYRNRQCAAYRDFRELIARDDVDAVCIATPDHWHAIPAIAAVRSGKAVYCEKPLSRTVAEGRAICRAVARYRATFQYGTQQRSDGAFRRACELVRSGRIGKVHTVEVSVPGGWKRPLPAPRPAPDPSVFDYDLWLGPAPWVPYSPERVNRWQWHHILDYTVGYLAGWGAHHVDIAQWGLGADAAGPVEFEGRGAFDPAGICDAALAWRVECTYADGVKMIFTDSGANYGGSGGVSLTADGGYRYPQGIRFRGSDGWVYVRRGFLDAHPKSLLREPIGPNDVHLYRSRGGHGANFIECIRTRRPTAAPVHSGHRSNSICLLCGIAVRLRRRLRWNPQAERFAGDDEANRMLSRAMRPPWRL